MGNYFKAMHPGKTTQDYMNEFPDALICSKKDKHNTTVNSGQFMKKPEYRKMFSEKLKGENNPNHRSRTTEQQRREKSPFCKEFYEKHEGNRDLFLKNVAKNRTYNTRLDYYLNQGMNEEEARLALEERQRTFTLEKCIAKYGEEEGVRRFNERQDKWSKKMTDLYEIGAYSKYPKKLSKNGTSELERKIVNGIIGFFKLSTNEFYCYLSKQFYLFDKTNKCYYFYDFKYKNKIIEINGDFWHMNPKKYTEKDVNTIMSKTALDIWKTDKAKQNLAKENGYDVLVVWESEIRENEKLVFDKINSYLRS